MTRSLLPCSTTAIWSFRAVPSGHLGAGESGGRDLSSPARRSMRCHPRSKERTTDKTDEGDISSFGASRTRAKRRHTFSSILDKVNLMCDTYSALFFDTLVD